MVDKRTKVGKAACVERETMTPRELAAKAALARFGEGSMSRSATADSTAAAAPAGTFGNDICIDDSSGEEEGAAGSDKDRNTVRYDSSDSEEDDDEVIMPHSEGCGCRSCDWSKMFFNTKEK